MSAVGTYRLPDEPLPSGLAKWAVDPLWPLLALMLAGNGLGLAWSAFNSVALGSPTRVREWIAVATSLLGCAALSLFFQSGLDTWLARSNVAYALLTLVTLKLAVAYVLYHMQARCFELWEHYGGRARNGFPMLILLAVVGAGALKAANLPVWLLLVFN